MKTTISKTTFEFLKKLKQNNFREWMMEHKKEYLANEVALKKFYSAVEEDLKKTDEIATMKIFRINRDIRFSNDKTPYNVHRSVSFSRSGEQRRGGILFTFGAGKFLYGRRFF